MFRNLIQAAAPSRMPLMTRASYRRELITSLSMPVAVSLVEGGVVGVLAANVFHASEVQVAMISAAGMFANLTSFFWAQVTRGRRKVPSIVAMMAAAALSVAGVALLPRSAAGAWGLVGLIVLTRCLLVGVITVRSAVWRHNYPRHMRGRITSRLAILLNLVLFLVPTVGSVALDAHEESFRIMYPLGAAAAIVGVFSFAGIRMRGERALLKFERRADAKPTRHGETPAIYEFDERQREPRMGMMQVLRRDPMFRRYMLWQFFAGVSNMMVEPVLIYMAAKETESLVGGFFIGTALTHGLPTLTTLLTLPLWARRLDKMHVAKFRVEQAWLWTVSQLVIWAGAVFVGPLWLMLVLMGIGRLVLGAARGAGTLAWNLGHNDFASREMVVVYMGINATLTGLRGAFAPFVGMALYTGWNADTPVLGPLLGAYAGIGGHVFAVSAVFSVISTYGFWELQRRMFR